MRSKDVDFVNYSSIKPLSEDFGLSEFEPIKFNDSNVRDPINHLNMTIDNVSSRETPIENSSHMINQDLNANILNMKSQYDRRRSVSKRISLNFIDLNINNPLTSQAQSNISATTKNSLPRRNIFSSVATKRQ